MSCSGLAALVGTVMACLRRCRYTHDKYQHDPECQRWPMMRGATEVMTPSAKEGSSLPFSTLIEEHTLLATNEHDQAVLPTHPTDTISSDHPSGHSNSDCSPEGLHSSCGRDQCADGGDSLASPQTRKSAPNVTARSRPKSKATWAFATERPCSKRATPAPDAYCTCVPRFERRVLKVFAHVPPTAYLHVRHEPAGRSPRAVHGQPRPACLDPSASARVELLPYGYLPRACSPGAASFDSHRSLQRSLGPTTSHGSDRVGWAHRSCPLPDPAHGWCDCRSTRCGRQDTRGGVSVSEPQSERFARGRPLLREPASVRSTACEGRSDVVGEEARAARARAEEERHEQRRQRAARTCEVDLGESISAPVSARAQRRADMARAAARQPATHATHSTCRRARSPGPAYYQPEIWTGR